VQGASLARFVTLAALIVSVALSLWLADADAIWIIVGVATAWLVASIIEWVAWNMGERDFGVYEREWRLRSGYDQPNVANRPVEETQVYAPPPVMVEPEPPPPPPVAEPDPVPGPVADPVPVPPADPAPKTARALRIGRLRIVLRGGSNEAQPVAAPEAVPEPAPTPEPAPLPDPEPEPLMLVAAPAAEAPAEPEPKPEPEPEPEPEPVPVEPPPPPPPPAVRAVPPPAPARAEPVAPPPQPAVTRLSARRVGPRQWNLWELERLARDGPPERSEEWHYLFVNLRRYAEPDGALPVEFDSLVHESFGPLLDRLD
jgi:hypothetical protein